MKMVAVAYYVTQTGVSCRLEEPSLEKLSEFVLGLPETTRNIELAGAKVKLVSIELRKPSPKALWKSWWDVFALDTKGIGWYVGRIDKAPQRQATIIANKHDRYLIDCCLSILGVSSVKHLKHMELMSTEKVLKQLDAKTYSGKYQHQFWDVWKELLRTKPELRQLRFLVRRWLINANQRNRWLKKVTPSELFQLLNEIDFSSDITALRPTGYCWQDGEPSVELVGKDWLSFIAKLQTAFERHGLIERKKRNKE